MSDRTRSRGGWSRREIAKNLLLGAAGATVVAGCEDDSAPAAPVKVIPPPNARFQTTVCAYCIVGCGYKVYTWPTTDPMGGESASDNGLGVDLPAKPGGPWISPEMVNTVPIDGVDHHIVVIPDWEATVVNIGGDHTLGASLARKLYNPSTPTADRLLYPQIRVDGKLHRISWGDAIDVIARYSQEVLDFHGPMAWGMKTYSYQFYENTYAITKLAFEAIETPCWAPHDKAAEGSDTPGLSDAGVNVFSASYQDWFDAEVIFVSGCSLYDAHGILFSQWVVRGGAKLIVVNPREDVTARYAKENGGLFLQIEPGTDTVLHNAIARIIVEEGWVDYDFVFEHTASYSDLLEETKWRQSYFGTTFNGYAADLTYQPDNEVENAAAICGIAPELIRQAAEMIAKPDASGIRPKSSFMLEKGNYWSHNYWNTASFGAMALLCGAGNRPGRMISRAGGHQRGMIKAARYPEHLSPHAFQGNQIGLNLDEWAAQGELDFVWVIGNTWAGGGSAATNALFESLRAQTRLSEVQLTEAEAFPDGIGGALDVDAVVAKYTDRALDGGMVMVQQDLYPQPLTELADIVLPAAGWGEGNFSRMQGERRLRLYPKLCDPPGECKTDWEIIQLVAQKMGFEGFDWSGSKELFERAAAASDGPHQFQALVEYAAANNKSARDVLREAGTTGYQCPLSLDNGKIKETERYHDAETGRGFSTTTGKALFISVWWSDVKARQNRLKPRANELWVVNRRNASNWSALIEDLRIPFRVEQMPNNVLEIHTDDAARLGIEHGTPVVVETAGVISESEWAYALQDGRFEAVACVTDNIRPGVTCSYFNYGGDPATAANNAVSNDIDPITNKHSYKLGRGIVKPG